MIQLITIILCAVLFFIGGWVWHNARRFLMPLVLCAATVYKIHDPWAMTMLSSMVILSLGYGDKSPLRHCFGDGWGRGVWGLLVALSLSLGLFLTHHLELGWFLAYLTAGFVLENALKKIPQCIGDPIIGAVFGTIILVIH